MMQDHINKSIALRQGMLGDEAFFLKINGMVSEILAGIKAGGKILIAGNGGSAADAQHFAAELVGRYLKDRAAIPAMALTTDTSVITAWSNDCGFDAVFERQVEALGKSGDVFFAISTSGNSQNILQAVSAAKSRGLKTICLLGRDGGKLAGEADHELIVQDQATPHIQEAHIMIIHIICGLIEKKLA